MKIAIAGISHETNTYCRGETQLNDFRITRGKKILQQLGMETSTGGALQACIDLGLDAVPVLIAWTQPSGTIALDAYLSMKQEILDGIEEQSPVDGVFLDLHGAGVVNGIEDLEGDLASSIRKLVGEAVPICASFDLHGNITQIMADALDGVFACHQYPHIDMHLRAAEAVQLIVDMLKDNFRPVLHVESVPMLMPTTTTFLGSGKEMLESILAEEDAVDIIDVSWFHGFPYTDIEHVGTHICVTSKGNRESAGDLSRKIARRLWDFRENFRALSLSSDEAVARAQASIDRPVIINETSDNCGGGSPGDGTHLLRSMLDAKLENACFGFIVDASVAEQAHKSGVGTSIDISLGAKYDNLHGTPLELNVYVKALHDGRLTMRAMGKGSQINYGKLARLQVNDMDIIVASHRSQTFDPEPFLAVGIDVTRMDYVALKSSNHFRAGFSELAGTIITADPPGLTTHHIEVFPRSNSREPLWPIDETAAYDPAE
ncbi:MAG: M81 family metallopeptidase [bacterium]|nr:M81 family peptidase [Gammaproteobacteria bacterium]